MGKIVNVKARMVLDSRGNPTVEAEVETQSATGIAIAPSGASTGVHEAVELRDGGKAFLGKGVKKAVMNVNELIAPKLKGMDATRQDLIDRTLIELDNTTNKSRLGANAIMAVSIACCKASAQSAGIQAFEHVGKLSENKEFLLPIPLMNVINGGAHAGNSLNIQEFIIMPIGASSFSEAVQMNVEVYHTLKSIIKDKFGKAATNVGDEGGFAPNIAKAEDALRLIQLALKEAGYEKHVKLAMDCASSGFFKDEKYFFEGKEYSNMKFVELLEDLIERYNIASIEDPLAEDDWQGFCALTKSRGKKCQIIGDDLLVTNTDRIQRAIKLNACNATLIKLNQIGTVSETLKAVKMSQEAGFNAVVSHRSGDSEDAFIADFAVGTGAGQLKSGAPCRSERTAKYNQLLRIEEELGKKAEYAGKRFAEKFGKD